MPPLYGLLWRQTVSKQLKLFSKKFAILSHAGYFSKNNSMLLKTAA